jgi:hypothetical protein
VKSTQNNRNPLSIAKRKKMEIVPILLSLALFSFAGCGKAAFNVTTSNRNAPAPGTYVIPPRVDIALFVDDTGSMYEAFPAIQGEVPKFLTKLEQQNWDYHFTIGRLTNSLAVTQVVGSKYDGNRSDWTPAYPGASRQVTGTLNSSVFRSPERFSYFPDQSWISNRRGGYEPGFSTITSTLESGLNNTGFLRSDSMLVVVVLGNGDDTSYLNLCPRADGSLVPCAAPVHPVCVPTRNDPTGGSSNCDSRGTSLEFFKNKLRALNPSAKMFSAVSLSASANCYGSRAYQGSRYMSLSSSLGGASFDVCSQSVAQVLDALNQSLQVERRSFRTKYIMIDQAPELSTIRVTRYVGGDTQQAQVIPQDPNNGWTYAGHLSNVAVIDQPIPMNVQSGYAIELHGSAKLIGNDTAFVEWKPEGAKDSVSQ